MILSAIAAMSKNRVIGKNNQLPWYVPEDLKYFKEKTTSKIMIMGRKTFESLPGVLKHRYHIVISRDLLKTADSITKRTGQKVSLPEHHVLAEGSLFAVVASLDAAIEWARQLTDAEGSHYNPVFSAEVFVIGGGEIYKQALERVDKIYLTIIHKECEGDTFFPDFKLSNFDLIQDQQQSDCTFKIYQKASHALIK
jgi:dihydrofolate reductase